MLSVLTRISLAGTTVKCVTCRMIYRHSYHRHRSHVTSNLLLTTLLEPYIWFGLIGFAAELLLVVLRTREAKLWVQEILSSFPKASEHTKMSIQNICYLYLLIISYNTCITLYIAYLPNSILRY